VCKVLGPIGWEVGCGVRGLGFEHDSSDFTCSGFWIEGSGLRVEGGIVLGFRFRDSGFGFSGFVFRVLGARPTQSEVTYLHVQRFRGGLVFKAQRLCVSFNSRLESNKEENEKTYLVPAPFSFSATLDV